MDIRTAREKKGMSQIEVSKAIGVHLNTYALWEKGGGNPSPENLAKLLKVLQMKETTKEG